MTAVRCPSCSRSLEGHRISEVVAEGTPTWEVCCDTPATVERHHHPRCFAPSGFRCEHYRGCESVTTYPLAPPGWFTAADVDALMRDLVVPDEGSVVLEQEALFGGGE